MKFFVRDKRFRLHEDGTLYEIPLTSDRERYRETVTTQPEHASHRQRLQAILDEFMAVEKEYGGATGPVSAGERLKKRKE